MGGYAFGPYVLRTDPRQLVRDGQVIDLGGRGLAILHALAENDGQTLSMKRLIERAWPDTEISPNSVHVHINTLRNRIGREWIATVAGEGYRLRGPVRKMAHAERVRSPGGPVREHLVDRERETEELGRMLRAHPLVTLSGPGGAGKSTLARHVVTMREADYEEGVAWVDVSAAADAMQLAAAVAAAAGLSFDVSNWGRALFAELAHRSALLVLDNCEHLVAEVADLCHKLAPSARGLHLLVTSQVPLLVSDEHVMRLLGLEVPPESATADSLLSYAAARLFVERASRSPNFELSAANATAVSDIVRLCDGLPLAIEIAAAQVSALGTDYDSLQRALLAMRRDLGVRRDVPERQTTIGAALQWSLATVPEDERTALATLAVFEGRFTAEAAQAVLDRPIDETRMLLADLVRRSLVGACGDRPRHRLLKLVRLQLLELLEASPRAAAVFRRHADYYTALASQLNARLTEDPGNFLPQMVEEVPNLRAALKWACGPGQSAPHALALCGDLYRYWDGTARYSQARSCVAAALAVPGSDAPELRASRLRALNAGAAAALCQGDFTAAKPMFEQMAALARALGDARQEGWALHGLGACALLAGDNAETVRATQAALRIMNELGDRNGEVACSTNLAQVFIDTDDLDSAHALAQRALDAARAGGGLIKAAFAHGMLGEVSRLRQDYAAAEGHMRTALQLTTELKAARGMAKAECGLASILLAQGDVRGSAAHFIRGLGMLLEAGPQQTLPEALADVADVLLQAGDTATAVNVLAALQRADEGGSLHLWRPERATLQRVMREAAMLMPRSQLEHASTTGRALSIADAGVRAFEALRKFSEKSQEPRRSTDAAAAALTSASVFLASALEELGAVLQLVS